MSNIERRYAYLDEGVFPVEGEYGVTYLTLYSSNAGNTYDGWVYDPDHRVEESLTERTYGYRNPDYPQYCWDDEVVVDLSNAQNRQESSEYVQGRITSFNTNVSSTPIFLPDVDITGLTEEERENRATTVLFSAIPLVKDAYIQAQVEVQCKCNLSPDNTSGEMRIEAFYILNDESDRTMRPNPVHTFFVDSENERHTLPWLYFNPALKHEDHNYIGVKLVCTGGTAEIGISDDPDYGDAIITLASAGLTGDHIDTGVPVSLEIFGKEEVIAGYELDINDYTVLCTYDTGETYEVTRMCNFTPIMGTEIIEPFTVLTAFYMGLTASMVIRLGQVEFIELSGVDAIHGSYTLDIDDYTVLAYLDNGDVMDVTDECTFSPAMGTTVSSTTVLTATYEPYWMPGSSFTDSLQLVAQSVSRQSSNSNDLIYTYYNDGTLVITGGVSDSWVADISNYESDEYLLSSRNVRGYTSQTQYSQMGIDGVNVLANQSFFTVSGRTLRNVQREFSMQDINQFDSSGTAQTGNVGMYFCIVNLAPFGMTIARQTTSIEWRATGKPLGITSPGGTTLSNERFYEKVKFINFDKMDTSKIITLANAFVGASESDYTWLLDKELPELRDITGAFRGIKDNPSLTKALNAHELVTISAAFKDCVFEHGLPKFISEMDTRTVKRADALFMNGSFEDVDSLYNWVMPDLLCSNSMFRNNTELKSVSALKNLLMNKNTDFGCMFYGDTELEDIGSILIEWGNNAGTGYNTGIGGSNGVCGMFALCTKLTGAFGIGVFLRKLPHSGSSVACMFASSGITSLLSFGGAITNKISNVLSFMHNCRQLTDLTGAETWDMSSVVLAPYMLYNTGAIYPPEKLSHISGWRLTSIVNPSSMLGVRYYETDDRTLAECDQLVQQSLDILSTMVLNDPDVLQKHFFNSPRRGYEIIYRHYSGSSYTDTAF